MRNQPIEKLLPVLQPQKKAVIIPHKSPDGDAMGSTLGLYHYLTGKGLSCTVISPNAYPEFLDWLPGNETVKRYDNNTAACDELIKAADFVFTLDFNVLSRVYVMQAVLEEVRKKEKAVFVMIDHHEQPGDYADFIYSIPEASSTCELIYNVIEKFGDKDKIDRKIATCLYTGIMTDTGSFKFSSTSSNTHRVIAELIDKGANHTQIHENIYDTKTFDQLQLLGVALNNLKVLKNKKTAYITLSQKELNDHYFKKGDTEGIVNYGLSLKGIILAAIFIENKDEGIIKISLRSKGDFNVNTMARTHFDGGGHNNAAGGRSFKELKETAKYFESILPQYKSLTTDVA